jgi:hypothetical protein
LTSRQHNHQQRGRYFGATATGFDLTPSQPPTDGCGKYLLLNVLVEELVDDAEEPMKRLESVFNLVGLVEALLLSMSITPFQDMKNWARDETNFAWGLSPLQGFCQKLGAYSLLITMGCCLVNLFLVTNVRSQPPPPAPCPAPPPPPPHRHAAAAQPAALYLLARHPRLAHPAGGQAAPHLRPPFPHLYLQRVCGPGVVHLLHDGRGGLGARLVFNCGRGQFVGPSHSNARAQNARP